MQRLHLVWGVVAITLLFTLPALRSFTFRDVDVSTCAMSYMWPQFSPVPLSQLQSRLAQKYALYRYADGSWRPNRPGVPVLFIPGNAGSYKQVRSLASAAAEVYIANAASADVPVPLDFYTIDLNEDMSAFHGSSLLQQAEFVNDVVQVILSLHRNDTNAPTSVVIVAHSMGGLVARAAFCLSNFQPGSVQSIVTLSSPHALPPASLERGVVATYEHVNEFWRQQGHLVAQKKPSLLDGVTLVSLAGGTLDTMISSDSTDVASIVPPDVGFTVFSTSIPHVWTSTDHLAILWCRQFVRRLSLAMLHTLSADAPRQLRSPVQRLRTFRDMLTGGFADEAPDLPDRSTASQSDSAITVPAESVDRIAEGSTILLDNRPQVWHARASHSSLSLLTNLPASSLQYLACRPAQDDLYTCQPSQARVETNTLPAFGVAQPAFDDQSYQFVRITEQPDDTLLVVRVDMRDALVGDTPFLQFDALKQTVTALQATLREFAFSWPSVSVPLNGTLAALSLPALENSLLSYRVRIHNLNGRRLLVRQSHRHLFESKFHIVQAKPDAAGDTADFFLNFHGQDNPADDAQRGVTLQIWQRTPTENSPDIRVEVSMDWMRSGGQLLKRYYGMIAAFPAAAGWLILRRQWQVYHATGLMPPLLDATAHVVKYLPLQLLLLTALSLLQCAQPDIFSIIASPGTFSAHRAAGIDPLVTRQALSGVVFLGSHDRALALLLPFFWVLGIGYFLFFYAVCRTTVWLMVTAADIVRRGTFDKTRLGLSKRFQSAKVEFKRRVFSLIALILLVTLFLPYQFSHLIAILVHLSHCVLVRLASQGQRQKAQLISLDRFQMTFFTFLFLLLPHSVPQVFVWIKNLSFSLNPASPQPNAILTPQDHNFLLALPIVVFVSLFANGRSLPQPAALKSSKARRRRYRNERTTYSTDNEVSTDEGKREGRNESHVRASSSGSSCSSMSSTAEQEPVLRRPSPKVRTRTAPKRPRLRRLPVALTLQVTQTLMLLSAVPLLAYGVFAGYWHEWVVMGMSLWLSVVWCLRPAK
ncbi:GPI inositol deacylase [Sorochytrium milnesiophthora]